MAIEAERTSTRFIVVLVLSVLTYGAWRAFTSRHAEPSAPISIEPFWILLLLVLAIMVFTALSAASGSTRLRAHPPELRRNDSLEEKNGSLERYRSARERDTAPLTKHRIPAKSGSLERYLTATGAQSDPPKNWEQLSKRERAHILGWIALFLSMAFHPIGGIIGLVILRRYSGADSMMVTVARVLIILGFVFTAIIFAPLIWTTINQ